MNIIRRKSHVEIIVCNMQDGNTFQNGSSLIDAFFNPVDLMYISEISFSLIYKDYRIHIFRFSIFFRRSRWCFWNMEIAGFYTLRRQVDWFWWP